MPRWNPDMDDYFTRNLREQEAKLDQADVEQRLLQPFSAVERERLRAVRRDYWLGVRFWHGEAGFCRLFVRWLIDRHLICNCCRGMLTPGAPYPVPIPPSFEAA